MSQTPGPVQGGGKVREKRRLSSDAPYQRTRPAAMPATRHSPTKAQPLAASPLPLGDIMQELALLRRAMEGGFIDAGKKSDAIRDEVVGKLDANDRAVSELQLAVTDVTLSVDQNQRAIHEVRAEVERREVELPDKVRAIVNKALEKTAGQRQPQAVGVRHRPLGGQLSAGSPTSAPTTDRKGEAYELARRSLKLWPVSREGDLHERTVEFLVNELRLDQQHATGLDLVVKCVGSVAFVQLNWKELFRSPL